MTNHEILNQINVESLNHEGRGVAHLAGKTIFLEGALPGEIVSFVYTKHHNKFDEAKVVEILAESSDRVTPKCQHFEICGGCSYQHLSNPRQLCYKTQIFQEQMRHFGGFNEINILPPIIGPVWSYRSRARLSVKYVRKKQKVLVGFHEKNGRFVADIVECPILHETVSNKIASFSKLVAELSIFDQIPQIEIACGDNFTVLLFRHLQKFTEQDLALLQKFGKEHNFQIYLQSGGNETIKPLNLNEVIPLSYKLPESNIEMFFDVTNFTQVNQKINQQMVKYVIELLAINSNDKILDLFCGIGNFTLPLAQFCKTIVGLEGNASSIMCAKQNALINKINNVEFYCKDLTKDFGQEQYDKILLDPPRTGAQEICSQIKKFGAKKIAYVSCNPATFARDAKEIVNNGYILKSVRLVDMFPHTKHIELIAEFCQKGE